ncbi:MAG: hypothetical protein E7285_10305 [Lachnospiraceae bacterium]|nr:hypothetical protein [Lachnospiraceae bacterium]
MKFGKGTKTTIVMLLMVVLIVGYYYYLSSRNEDATSLESMENQVQEEMTPVQELLAMAAYKEYPPTPVQVLKYYNEITACFYNETYTEEELEDLAYLAQSLYDTELVINQTDYIEQLQEDIQVFRDGNIIVYSSEVTPSTDVEYFEHNGYECARLYCLYTLKSGTIYQTTRQVFIMRLDEDGHWKIFGFDLAETEE